MWAPSWRWGRGGDRADHTQHAQGLGAALPTLLPPPPPAAPPPQTPTRWTLGLSLVLIPLPAVLLAQGRWWQLEAGRGTLPGGCWGSWVRPHANGLCCGTSLAQRPGLQQQHSPGQGAARCIQSLGNLPACKTHANSLYCPLLENTFSTLLRNEQVYQLAELWKIRWGCAGRVAFLIGCQGSPPWKCDI